MNFQLKPTGHHFDKILQKSIPLLPGNSFDFNVGAEKFNRPQYWVLSEGIPVLANRDALCVKPAVGGENPPVWANCEYVPRPGVFPKGKGPKTPSWVAFDKQVLAFKGYWQEPIPESALENYRVHQCKIYYYLEDDTIQVLEPKTYNSGMPQGEIIRRHRISLPPPVHDQYFTVEHFNVGCELTFYGKTFVICSCDGFTRNFLNRLGIPVPLNLELPKDIGTEKIKDLRISQFPRRPYDRVDTRGKFLQHDRHVLRFWAYWDDRCHLYGDLREFVIHYYLMDDTIEIREIIRPNSGYDSFPVFIKRGKIPKQARDLVPLPGEETPLTILNVFGSMHGGLKNKKGHFMVDQLGIGRRNIEYYTHSDLAIGSVLNAFGRAFLLTNCDDFTKQYYKEKYQIEDMTPLVIEERKKEFPKPEPPPYNGWGTEEDSLKNWKKLWPPARHSI